MNASGKLHLVSVGPGFAELIPPMAQSALRASDAIVSYELYLKWITPWIEGKEIHSFPLTRERERAAKAIELARAGRVASLVSSGDIGVYAMASLVLEEMREGGRFRAENYSGHFRGKQLRLTARVALVARLCDTLAIGSSLPVGMDRTSRAPARAGGFGDGSLQRAEPDEAGRRVSHPAHSARAQVAPDLLRRREECLPRRRGALRLHVVGVARSSVRHVDHDHRGQPLHAAQTSIHLHAAWLQFMGNSSRTRIGTRRRVPVRVGFLRHQRRQRAGFATCRQRT